MCHVVFYEIVWREIDILLQRIHNLSSVGAKDENTQIFITRSLIGIMTIGKPVDKSHLYQYLRYVIC